MLIPDPSIVTCITTLRPLSKTEPSIRLDAANHLLPNLP